MRVGFTCSTFDLFHAGHIDMLQQARRVCDYLIVGLQTDPSIDRSFKSKPIQSIVERQLQLKATQLIDEIYVYETEKDLEDLLNILQIDVRIIGEEYKNVPFTGKNICLERGIEVVYNRRRHTFSSSELRQRVMDAESKKVDTVHITPYGLTMVDCAITGAAGVDTIEISDSKDPALLEGLYSWKFSGLDTTFTTSNT
jgi:glycerol-3-phosphate cytidylyltransferase